MLIIDLGKLIPAFIFAGWTLATAPLFGFPNGSLQTLSKCCKTSLTCFHWLHVGYRTDSNMLVLVYKSLNGSGPKYISDMLEEYKPSRPLRSVGSGQFEVPWAKTKHHVGFCHYAGGDPKCTPILVTFRSKLKTFLFSFAFDWLYSLLHFYVPY